VGSEMCIRDSYKNVYPLLKEKRALSMQEIYEQLKDIATQDKIKAGIGMLFRKGEAYFDIINNKVRFRHLCNEPIPEELYKITDIEKQVEKYSKDTFNNMKVKYTPKKEFIFSTTYNEGNWCTPSHTQIVIDQDSKIVKLNCNCYTFKRGAKNISEPCAHILALYVASFKLSDKLSKLESLEYDKEYEINDIMEMLL